MPPATAPRGTGATIGPAPAAMDPWSLGAAAPAVGTLSASEFIDDTALPDWLRSQGTPQAGITHDRPPQAGGPPQERQVPPYAPGSAASPGTASKTFAASDLIDPEAVPSWIQGEGRPAVPTFSSVEGWTSKGPSMPLAADANRASQSTVGFDVQQSRPGSDRLVPGGAPANDGLQTPGWQVPGRGTSRVDSTGDVGVSSNVAKGLPIPQEELPTWLRTDRPAGRASKQAIGGGQEPTWRRQPEAARAMDAHDLGTRDAAPDQYAYDVQPQQGQGMWGEAYGPGEAPIYNDGQDEEYDDGSMSSQYAPTYDEEAWQEPDYNYGSDYGPEYERGYSAEYGGEYGGGYGASAAYDEWDDGYEAGENSGRPSFWGRLFGRR